MFDKLDVFQMAQALARHSSARQAGIAGNVANADTPGYRARDVAPFSQVYEPGHGAALRATREQHLGGGAPGAMDLRAIDSEGPGSPNGNTVSLEAEMMKSVEVQHRHETALSVYETARNILRTSLGRGR